MQQSQREQEDLERDLQDLKRRKQGDQGVLTWARLKEIAEEGPIAFCQKALGFEPTQYQIRFLTEAQRKQFIVLVWCRQSGKSFIVAAFLFWEAVKYDGWQTAIVGPSFRQSKLVIRKITSFLQKMPKSFLVGRKPLRTKIALINGSILEAYPCNPDTIRGPTLNRIFADEFNFVRDDEELYDAILFTLGTTNGGLIATSTPWARDHVFYKMCNDPDFSDYERLRVRWDEAEDPKGPLKKNILAKIRRQLAADPWRWRREMEAEWAEDEDCWLPTSLITTCTDAELEIRELDRMHSFWAVDLGPTPT